tara:strand:- start:1165 stop:1446 length:282 start_codon:yes stop_codon:yes gene_type:complete
MANITWDTANFLWDLNPHLWNLVEELVSGGGDSVPRKLEELPKEKKKKFIRLIMEFKGIKVYDEKKEVKNIKAYAKDVKIIAEEIKRNVQIIH